MKGIFKSKFKYQVISLKINSTISSLVNLKLIIFILFSSLTFWFRYSDDDILFCALAIVASVACALWAYEFIKFSLNEYIPKEYIENDSYVEKVHRKKKRKGKSKATKVVSFGDSSESDELLAIYKPKSKASEEGRVFAEKVNNWLDTN